MKKLIFVLSAISLSLPAFAESPRFYVALHGNNSWSITKDGEQRIDKENGGLNPGISVAAGVETGAGKSKDFQLLLGAELFFDYINKTTVQNNTDWINRLGGVNQRPMSNKPIYKTNFLTGVRGKIGMSLFNKFDLYGHTGLLYWGRDLYVNISDDPYWDMFGDDNLWANWKIMPFAGIGTTFHMTDNWAINASYMKVLHGKIGGVWNSPDGNDYNYSHGSFKIGIDVLTVGVQYYF